MDKTDDMFRWSPTEGTYKKQEAGDVLIANFYPKVVSIQDIQEETEVVLELSFVSGIKSEVKFPIRNINRVDWFQLDHRCIVEEGKIAQSSLKLLVRLQIANYENEVSQIIQYAQLGWNTNAYGNAVYVCGNYCIGGNGDEIISSALAEYKMQVDNDDQYRILDKFLYLFENSPVEGSIALLYFFSGLIKSLYREAGTPVDFVLYIFGEQQSRKTTLAKLTNNLYNRDTDMEYAVRTVVKTSITTAEKLISLYKDSTLILDDIFLTGNRSDQQKQENVMESVVRLLGNSARKSSNVGNSVKEYYPYANVIITGEYLPSFPASTLSRMLIVNVKKPVDSKWLEEFGREPLMLSTVAYMFLSWIQTNYQERVDFIRQCFEQYSITRNEQVDVQKRILDHGFVLLCTSCLLQYFFEKHLNLSKEEELTSSIEIKVRKVMKKQEKLMRQAALKFEKKDFCKAFAELYVTKKLDIAEAGQSDFWVKNSDGFMYDKKTICIKTAVLCQKMQDYYKDTSITIQQVTKQLRGNRFLITDNSKHSKSTKKVGNVRYLHISKDAVKDYYECFCE